jgi:hypothetical protein
MNLVPINFSVQNILQSKLFIIFQNCILNNRYVKVINDELPIFSKVIKPHVLQYLNDRKYSILKYWNDSQFHLPISPWLSIA